MTTTEPTGVTSQQTSPGSADTGTTGRSRAFRNMAGVLRLSLAWVFLWAFLDKAFALGFNTGRNPETGAVSRFGDAAWIHGGSPTTGFLKFGTQGPLATFYQASPAPPGPTGCS